MEQISEHVPVDEALPPPPTTSAGEPDIESDADASDVDAAAESPAEPSLHQEGVTKARCATCGETQTWTGRADIPTCSKGHGALTVVAVTGTTAEEAIAIAAQQLPAEKVEPPRQMALPGVRPKFNFEAAWDSIEKQQVLVDNLTATFNDIAGRAKHAKKRLDDETEALCQLIRDYRTRRQEMSPAEESDDAGETASTTVAAPRPPCAFEEMTGQPCAVCATPTDGITPAATDTLTHAAAAAYVAVVNGTLSSESLRLVLQGIAHRYIPEVEIDVWPADDRQAVALWLEKLANDHDGMSGESAPAVLGTPHEVGLGTGQCVQCLALLHPLAASFGFETFPEGTLVGTDCTGEAESKEPEREEARPVAKRHASRASATRAKQKARRQEREHSSRGRGKKRSRRP